VKVIIVLKSVCIKGSLYFVLVRILHLREGKFQRRLDESNQRPRRGILHDIGKENIGVLIRSGKCQKE